MLSSAAASHVLRCQYYGREDFLFGQAGRSDVLSLCVAFVLLLATALSSCRYLPYRT